MKNAIKILVCDYIGNSKQWLENFTVQENYEVVGTISQTSDKNLLLEKNWNYLLIFEQGSRQFFNLMIQFMNIAPDRVIYALDLSSWISHPAAVFNIINPNGGGANLQLSCIQFRT